MWSLRGLLVAIWWAGVLGFEPIFSRALRRKSAVEKGSALGVTSSGSSIGTSSSSSGSGGDIGGIHSSSRKRKHAGNRKITTRLDDTASVTEGFSQAFIGGTTGVLGVMFSLELQKVTADKMEDGCPYCISNGEILCAMCCGSGKCVAKSGGVCEFCGGRGLVQCINCKGDGRIIPIILQSKAVRDPEFSPDQVSLDAP